MYLDGVDEIERIATQSNFCIFEISPRNDQAGILPKAIHIRRGKTDGKDDAEIKKEAIKNIQDLINTKQTSDLIIVIEEAELLNINAANSFLKCLEEPTEHIRYVMLTTKLNTILPTIRSRAFCYKLKQEPFNKDKIDIKLRAKVKEFISAKPADLAKLAKTYGDDKKSGRVKALELCQATTELCLNTFLETGNKVFLDKARRAAEAHENIKANGNVKIQLIACML
jgi:DNA polymerase III gamma/tau subunit